MYDIKKIKDYLVKNLSNARYKHTLGTLRIAQDLGLGYKVLPIKIEVAALLHDVGKGFTREKLVNYVKKSKIKVPYIDEIVRYNPWLLHGYAGALIAKTVFRVRDKEILDAISCHTVAKPGMNVLEKIIYLADITAPDRRFPYAKRLRWHAKRNLDNAMLLALSVKMQHVLANRKWMHPLSVKTWNLLVCSKR